MLKFEAPFKVEIKHENIDLDEKMTDLEMIAKTRETIINQKYKTDGHGPSALAEQHI